MEPSKWISLFEQDIFNNDLTGIDADNLTWDLGIGMENLGADSSSYESRKRNRDECPSTAKACREKMRRDRMNDRFMELSAVLEPDKPPKTDKASILRDAARILTQLRMEAQQLKETNQSLQETIRELKVEKNELKDEKLSLKYEKEKLEKQLKSMSMVPGLVAHSGSSIAAYPSLNHIHHTKPALFEMPSHTIMSQLMPSTTIDISNDHVLRPPAA